MKNIFLLLLLFCTISCSDNEDQSQTEDTNTSESLNNNTSTNNSSSSTLNDISILAEKFYHEGKVSVVVNEDNSIDFSAADKTQNTRVSYPIYHIDNIVKPVSKGTHPKRVIFLTCDAYGVLPPIAKLNADQALYHFLLGFTSKAPGTESGVIAPEPTFSACFGAAFLTLHPTPQRVYPPLLMM